MDAKINILIVDDHPGKLLTYEAMLEELGENLIKARSGMEALDHLWNTDVAVVLMDLCMPGMDGLETAKMIHTHPRFQNTPIIFISAIHVTDLDRLKGYEHGAVDYVSVPVVPQLLRAKVQVFAELHRKTQQLEILNERITKLRDEERRHFARELHDSVGQLLTAISMSNAVIESESYKLSPEVAKRLSEQATLTAGAIKQVPTISHLLHPPLLDEAGLASALRCYTEGFCERSEIEVKLEIPEAFAGLSKEMELTIFRVVQECLTNVHRHAESPTARIGIVQNETCLTVEIEDTGKGIDPEIESSDRAGVGLRGMRERLRKFGGTLQVRRILLFSLLALCVSFAQTPVDVPSSQSAEFLDHTVMWYQRVVVEREMASSPRDAVFVNDNARVRDQIVRLAFDFARSEEQSAGKRANTDQEQSTAPSRYEALTQMSGKLDAQAQQTQQEIESLRKQLDSATGRKRQDIQATIAETQSELQLIDARREVLHTMVEFVGSTTEGMGSTGLAAQIDALSHSVPAALTTPSGAANHAEEGNSGAAIPTSGKAEPAGLWGLIATVVSASRKIHTLDQDIQITDALAQDCKRLQTPLINQLRQLTQQSDAIATQADADTRTSLAQDKGELDHLTAQFKLISAAFVPLGKQAILVDLYSRNLTSWRNAVKDQYVADLKNLLIRLLTLGLILAIVWGVAEVWRRAIFRYVHDTRRRYQMLLLRRIALWLSIAVVIAFAFASELGSVATFAGLLTAGVAVALQNVILSIAGYFFLIGKFGLRVGDRVQISGVNGEVVEIGLVRIHVMELGGNGRDVQPTGRVVAFSNSFVFQPTAGMFKQIPGTDFVWHEITLTLATESDYRSVEERMTNAVDTAFAEYHENLERQRVMMETSLGSVNIAPLRPRTSLRLSSSGLEVKVSFPVEVQEAMDIDDRVTREILEELDREPRLKMVGSDIPTIRQMTAVPAAKAS